MTTSLIDTYDTQELNREILAGRTVLSQAKLGCVSYLNSHPLIYGVENLFDLDSPANLARKLRAGELQGALVPVHELLTGPDYQVAGGLAIASDGPVYSVIMAHQEEALTDLERVYLTTESRSSRDLLRILLTHFEECEGIDYLEGPFPGIDQMEPRTGYLLIGDEALLLRQSADADAEANSGLRFYDLGEAWKTHTDLPFIYALWALRPDVRNAERITHALTITAELGLLNRNRLAHEQTIISPDLAQRYLTSHIQYSLTDRGKVGMTLFGKLLRELGG